MSTPKHTVRVHVTVTVTDEGTCPITNLGVTERETTVGNVTYAAESALTIAKDRIGRMLAVDFAPQGEGAPLAETTIPVLAEDFYYGEDRK